MLRSLTLGALAVTLLAPSILGQGCSQPGQTFFKNDVLPDVPSGSTPVALIGGLC